MHRSRFHLDGSLRAQLRFGDARPPIVWTAALLYTAGAARAALAVAVPLSTHFPATTIAIVGIVCGLIAMVLWLRGGRLPRGAMHVVAATATVIASVVVASAHTEAGTVLAAFSYPWIALYCAHFFRPRAVVVHVGLISAGFGAALIASGRSHMLVPWVMVASTVSSFAWILAHLSESLRRQADTDQLTGLLNRKGFLAAAGRARANASRAGESLTLVVLDLDGFKQVNDNLGHAAGDRLLADIGAAWKRSLRAGDVLARHGGDEFVLLLSRTGPEGAQEALARLHVPELPIEWSVGVSEWTPDEDIDSALARADRDLYTAKGLLRQSGGGVAPQRQAGAAPGARSRAAAARAV